MRTMLLIASIAWNAGPAVVDWLEIVDALRPVVEHVTVTDLRPAPRPSKP